MDYHRHIANKDHNLMARKSCQVALIPMLNGLRFSFVRHNFTNLVVNTYVSVIDSGSEEDVESQQEQKVWAIR